MSQRVIIVSVLLFAALVAGMFVFAYLERTNLSVEPVVTDTADSVTEQDRFDHIESVDAKIFYIDGVYTLVGEILMPTPCDLLQSEAIVAESFPEIVQLNFTILNNAETCAQVMTPARFKIEVPASIEASFHAHFMDRDIRLNIIPAAPGETPDEFELFTKG